MLFMGPLAPRPAGGISSPPEPPSHEAANLVNDSAGILLLTFPLLEATISSLIS